MRLVILRLSLASALLACGCGNALAASICPGALGTEAATHACCRHRMGAASSHCHGHAEQSAMLHAEHSAASVDVRVVSRVAETATSARPAEFCNCASRQSPSPSTVVARNPVGVRRGACEAAPREKKQVTFSDASLTAALIPREHAPPASSRRHVLVGVFRI